jgi:hypothetical protein
VEGNGRQTATRPGTLACPDPAPSWPRTLPTGARCAVHPYGGRQLTPSHAMMAAKGDDAEPERARRRGHGGRGQPSRRKGIEPRGPAGRAGPRCPPASRGLSLRALPGCASAPGAARAVGWGDGRLCRVPAGAARRRRGARRPMIACGASVRGVAPQAVTSPTPGCGVRL